MLGSALSCLVLASLKGRRDGRGAGRIAGPLPPQAAGFCFEDKKNTSPNILGKWNGCVALRMLSAAPRTRSCMFLAILIRVLCCPSAPQHSGARQGRKK